MIAAILFAAVVAGSLFLSRPRTVVRPVQQDRAFLLTQCFAFEQERAALFGEIRVVARTSGYDSDFMLCAWHLRQARIQWLSARIAEIRKHLDLTLVFTERQVLLLRSMRGGLLTEEVDALLR